jgi:L-alanine-DL-glutamate epimerase-like enolase superfamily enzyme
MAELVVRPVSLRLRSPLRAAWGSLSERELLQVRVDFGEGDFGEGEAAPIEAYDGVSLAAVRAALARARPTPNCWRRARPSARSRTRWRRSTSPCGTARAAAPASRSRS